MIRYVFVLFIFIFTLGLKADDLSIIRQKYIESILYKNKSEQQKNITIIDYDGTNRNQLLEEMSRSIYIIAARFHGTILGLTAGKSVFPILYSDKTKYVLEDLGFHGEYADLRDPDSLSFENAKKNLESGYKIDVTESVQNAEKHFEKLDEFLNN
mgnify:CR=1 FL=1